MSLRHPDLDVTFSDNQRDLLPGEGWQVAASRPVATAVRVFSYPDWPHLPILRASWCP